MFVPRNEQYYQGKLMIIYLDERISYKKRTKLLNILLVNIVGRDSSSAGDLKVKTLPRCVLCHSLFQYCCAGNSHHNCMIIPHPSPLITRSLSNYFFYFLCWAPLPDLMTRDLRLHNKMLSDLETDSTLIVGFNTLPPHETCYHTYEECGVS